MRAVVLVGLLLLVVVTEAAGPAPELRIQAPPELAGDAARVRALAGGDFGAILRLTGSVGFTRPIEVLLVPETAELARRTPRWVAGFADGRRAVVVLFPARVPSYPDRTLEALLHHEVAHVMVAEAAAGRPVPRWFNEGVATVAAREWGMEDGARYALAVVGRQERSTDDLDRAFVEGGRRASRAYALSSAFVRFLLDRHGPGATGAILAEVGAGHPFREAYRRATGSGLAADERLFFVRRAMWYTWLPFLTSSAALWMAITALALLAFKRRRERNRALHELWEAAEAPAVELDEPVN